MPVMASIQFRFKCPLCEESITLPRLSELGTYINEKYHLGSTPWPISWICAAHERICDCFPETIERIEFEIQPNIKYPAAVWKVEHPCGQENCEVEFNGYTWGHAAESSGGALVERLIDMKPEIKCCVGHEMAWNPRRLKATLLPF